MEAPELTVELEASEPTVEPLPNEDLVEVTLTLRGDLTKLWRYHFEQSFRPGCKWAWNLQNRIELYVDPDIEEKELLEDLGCLRLAVADTNELIERRTEHTDEGEERVRDIIHTWHEQSRRHG